MSYKVSQLRKVLPDSSESSDGEYMSLMSLTQDYVFVDSPFQSFSNYGNSYFPDFALRVEDGLQANQIYYLRGQILRVPEGYYSLSDSQAKNFFQGADDLKFTILLADKNVSQHIRNDYQELTPQLEITRAFRDSIMSESQRWYHFQIVFQPKKNYNYIVFKMQRNTYDVLGPTETQDSAIQSTAIIRGRAGRHWLLEKKESKPVFVPGYETRDVSVESDKIKFTSPNGQLCSVKNIGQNMPWKKFGIQARPGTLIVVNKQPIYIGRSGIYQLNNGTDITSFMITAPGGYDNDKIDAFLLDYMYEE